MSASQQVRFVAFVPPETRPNWLEPVAENNPFTTMVDAARALFVDTPGGNDVWGAVAWSVAIIAVFSVLSVCGTGARWGAEAAAAALPEVHHSHSRCVHSCSRRSPSVVPSGGRERRKRRAWRPWSRCHARPRYLWQ